MVTACAERVAADAKIRVNARVRCRPVIRIPVQCECETFRPEAGKLHKPGPHGVREVTEWRGIVKKKTLESKGGFRASGSSIPYSSGSGQHHRQSQRAAETGRGAPPQLFGGAGQADGRVAVQQCGEKLPG